MSRGPATPCLIFLAAVIVAVVADFAATGISTIRQDEQGIVLRFGAVSRSLSPGIQFTLPWPIERVEVVNTSETRKMPVGFRLVQGRDPTPSGPTEREFLTGDTNVIDVNMMIHYVIVDPKRYLFDVGADEASFLVRKCAESVLTEKIAVMRVDEVLTTGKVAIQEEVRRCSQDLLDRIGAGIKVLLANIQDIAPPEEVKSAFNDVSRAKADMERSIEEARGYVNDRLPRARGEANKIRQDALIYESTVVAGAKGRAERFLSLYAEYTQAKEITRSRLFLETIERALAPGEKIVVTPDGDGKARVRIVR
jgi:modulator of FtsH protease HflK